MSDQELLWAAGLGEEQGRKAGDSLAAVLCHCWLSQPQSAGVSRVPVEIPSPALPDPLQALEGDLRSLELSLLQVNTPSSPSLAHPRPPSLN